MQQKNRYLYYSILPCCLLLIAIGVYVSGYNPPTQGPPFGNLPAPINAGEENQTKKGGLTIQGDLIAEGIFKLGQFDTAPSGAEGALYFNTDKNSIQIYISGSWKDLIVATLGLGETCRLDGDCGSGFCVDEHCCNASCEGTCQRCNVAGSLGACIEVPSDCTGGCSTCISGNCIADSTKCTGNCVQCTGSGATASCSAEPSLCTGSCSFCNGSGTEYNCAGSNGFCSNTVSSCGCSGSGTVWNCQSCSGGGVCQAAACSAYSCSLVNRAGGYQTSGCSGCDFCNGSGACVSCHWAGTGSGGYGYYRTETKYYCNWGNNGLKVYSGAGSVACPEYRKYAYYKAGEGWAYQYKCTCE